MRAESYEIKEGKDLSFSLPSRERFTRSNKPGDKYTGEALMERENRPRGRAAEAPTRRAMLHGSLLLPPRYFCRGIYPDLWESGSLAGSGGRSDGWLTLKHPRHRLPSEPCQGHFLRPESDQTSGHFFHITGQCH